MGEKRDNHLFSDIKSEPFQRLAGFLAIAATRSWREQHPSVKDPLARLEQLGELVHSSGIFPAEQFREEMTKLLMEIAGADVHLGYAPSDISWLFSLIQEAQKQPGKRTLLSWLLAYAVTLATQAHRPLPDLDPETAAGKGWYSPRELAELSPEGASAWHARLQQRPDEYLAVRGGKSGAWLVPLPALLARGIRPTSVCDRDE